MTGKCLPQKRYQSRNHNFHGFYPHVGDPEFWASWLYHGNDRELRSHFGPLAGAVLCTDWIGLLADRRCFDCRYFCKGSCCVQLCRPVRSSEYQFGSRYEYAGWHFRSCRFWTAQCVLPDDFLPAVYSLCGDIGNDPQGSGQHSLDAAVCIVPVGCGVGCHLRCLSNWTSSVR